MDIEMENLPKKEPIIRVDDDDDDSDVREEQPAEENTIHYWAWGSAAWYVLHARVVSAPSLLAIRN